MLEDGRKAVKWATDYFLKCHVEAHKLYGQVGLGDLDHNSWGRPEDMTMERPAFYIDEANPGMFTNLFQFDKRKEIGTWQVISMGLRGRNILTFNK